jgi:hypothetical protein
MMSFIEKKKKVWFGKGAVVIEIEPPPPPPPPPQWLVIDQIP